jgi:hypothetical protein
VKLNVLLLRVSHGVPFHSGKTRHCLVQLLIVALFKRRIVDVVESPSGLQTLDECNIYLHVMLGTATTGAGKKYIAPAIVDRNDFICDGLHDDDAVRSGSAATA